MKDDGSRARGNARRHEEAQTAKRQRVRDLVYRMTSGERVEADAYARETGCTLAQARDACATAVAVRAFLSDDVAYREKLQTVADEALDDARGSPALVARLIEPLAKLRGYIQPASVNIVQLNQRVVILKDAALDWARSELAPTMLDRLERAGLLVDAGRAVDVLTDGIVDATEALEARLDAAKVAEGKERGNG